MMSHQHKEGFALVRQAKAVLCRLRELRRQVEEDGGALYAGWERRILREGFRDSARNLAHYMALRRHDLNDLQWELIPLGLSSLGRLEARVMPTLDAVLASCAKAAGEVAPAYPSPEAFMLGEGRLDENSAETLGPEPADRYTRIMVTLPSEAAREPLLVHELVARGMEVARINCSHDDEEAWRAMISHVRSASRALNRPCRISMEIPGPKVRIDLVLTKLRRARVFKEDRIFLTGDRQMFLPPGVAIAIRCSVPEVIDSLGIGEQVIIDDGHVEARVEERLDAGVILRVTRVVRERGIMIRAEKGINFPGSDYRIPLLGSQDQSILHFICRHADIIGCSFVRDEADIELLLSEINRRLPKPDSVPIILKIETLESMRILPQLLVAAASRVPTAVMIARGDLAVEVGYSKLSEYQEEILWICEAAHVPVIWATQVVETMVQTGIPTRAEVSDVTLAAKSECIMLNKGEHINDAVSFVAGILQKFEKNVYKKTAILRRLSIASGLFEGQASGGEG